VPLLHGLNGGRGEDGVSIDQAHACDVPIFIDHSFEDNGSWRAGFACFRGKCWWNAVSEAFFRALRRENEGGSLAG